MGMRAGDGDALAHNDERALSIIDQPRHIVHRFLRRGHQVGPIAGEVHLIRPGSVGLRILDIAADIDEDGAGPPGGGDVESLHHHRR